MIHTCSAHRLPLSAARGFPSWQLVFKGMVPWDCCGSIRWVLRLTHQIQWQRETGDLVSCCDIHTVPHPGWGVETVVPPGLNPGIFLRLV